MVSQSKVFSAIDSEVHLMESTNGWYRFTNPLDSKSRAKGDDTMAYNPTYGWVKCFRTGYSKSAVDFLMDLWGMDYVDAMQEIETFGESVFRGVQYRFATSSPTVTLPEGFKRLVMGQGIFGPAARNYLTNRGFDVNKLDNMGFGYCDHGSYMGYVIIPYVSSGKLIYWSSRAFMNYSPKYKNPPADAVGVGKSEVFFNEDAMNIHDTVYVLEGAFDALTIGPNAIASSGWSLSDIQVSKMVTSSTKRFVFVPDVGYYETAKQQAAKIIFHKRVSIVPTHLIDGWTDANAFGLNALKPYLKDLPDLNIVDVL